VTEPPLLGVGLAAPALLPLVFELLVPGVAVLVRWLLAGVAVFVTLATELLEPAPPLLELGVGVLLVPLPLGPGALSALLVGVLLVLTALLPVVPVDPTPLDPELVALVGVATLPELDVAPVLAVLGVGVATLLKLDVAPVLPVLGVAA